MDILLVDDNDDFRSVVAQLLERAGHVVRTANSVQEALHCLQEAAVDLLITDIIMPMEDGLALMKKAQQQFPDLAIIAISGASAHSTLYLKIAGHLGAAATLLKPFSEDELLVAIARIELSRATNTRSEKSARDPS